MRSAQWWCVAAFVLLLHHATCLADEPAEKADKKVAGLVKRGQNLRTQFIKEMEKELAREKKRRGDVDEVAANIRDIEQGIADFKSERGLPTCNALLGHSIDYCNNSWELAREIADYRAKLKKSANQQGAAAIAQLAPLEQELQAIVTPRTAFVTGSVWVGSMLNPIEPADWRLTVTRVEGDKFLAELVVNPGNRGPRYSVEGQFEGAVISLSTTAVLKARGRNKQMQAGQMQGILLKDRIVGKCQISTFGAGAAEGSVDLARK